MTSTLSPATLRWLHDELLARRSKEIAWWHVLVVMVLACGGCDFERPKVRGQVVTDAVTTVDLAFPYRIELTGTDHRWRMEYSGIQGAALKPMFLETGSDLYVPVGTRILLALQSTDYIYTLAVPDFGIKEIAVPRLEFTMEFLPTELGKHELVGDELCGGLRGKAPGRLIVEPVSNFQDRLRRWRILANRRSNKHRETTN